MCVRLLPTLAVAQKMEVTVEEGAESYSETKINGRKHPLGVGLRLGLGLALPSPLQLSLPFSELQPKEAKRHAFLSFRMGLRPRGQSAK